MSSLPAPKEALVLFGNSRACLRVGWKIPDTPKVRDVIRVSNAMGHSEMNHTYQPASESQRVSFVRSCKCFGINEKQIRLCVAYNTLTKPAKCWGKGGGFPKNVVVAAQHRGARSVWS